MLSALKKHWPEYLMEAAGLGLTMIALATCALLFLHPASPLVELIPFVTLRRMLMGLCMAVTAAALVYSPWGKQSGAHFNPAVTLTYFRLGRVAAADALFYSLFQLIGGLAGVCLMRAAFGRWLADPAIHHVTSMPGMWGAAATWGAEFAMTLLTMSVVLTVSNSSRFAVWTGLCAATIVALNVSLIIPLFGTSMNPARTLAAAIPDQAWMSSWVYFTAGPLGMLTAAQVYLWRKGPGAVFCAKLHHQNGKRCIFCATRTESAASGIFAPPRNQGSARASNKQHPPAATLPDVC